MNKTIESENLEKDTELSSSQLAYRRLPQHGYRWHVFAIATLGVCLSGTGNTQQPAVVFDPRYEYRTEINNNKDLCGHMLKVFNTRFQALWNTEPLMPGDDPNYSPQNEKYAFPRTEGVAHDKRATFDMAFSKFPSSPEFDAIYWSEGRFVFGDPPASAGPVNLLVQPMLVAHIDFDNDGRLDTVAKISFAKGYSYMATATSVGLHAEYMLVWKGKKLVFENPQSLWEVWNGAPKLDRPVVINETYIRPFIYKGKTYVATYDMDIGEDGEAIAKPPHKPAKETMTVVRSHATSDSDAASALSMKGDTECAFNMIQILTKNQ